MRSIFASCIACFTAAAVASIWAARPISCGSKSRVAAMPMASRFSPFGDPAGVGVRAKMVACGLSTPSVPPDTTMAIRRSTSAGVVRR